MYVYPEDAKWLTDELRRRGHDPNNKTTDPATPQGVGNAGAAAVIDYRRHDGANQFGDEVGGDGKPYADYTYYVPVNSADKIIDPDRWQPITFTPQDGRKVHARLPHAALVSREAVRAGDAATVPPAAAAENNGRTQRH